MVDLKPEGYQLIKLKEDLLSYLTEGSRQHLITAFWEYLLLLEVTYKVLEKIGRLINTITRYMKNILILRLAIRWKIFLPKAIFPSAYLFYLIE
jgi:hypothetical protein